VGRTGPRQPCYICFRHLEDLRSQHCDRRNIMSDLSDPNTFFFGWQKDLQPANAPAKEMKEKIQARRSCISDRLYQVETHMTMPGIRPPSANPRKNRATRLETPCVLSLGYEIVWSTGRLTDRCMSGRFLGGSIPIQRQLSLQEASLHQ
jgi:hypothetical protein